MPTSSVTPIRISILGSTGSIGTQTLDVIARLPDRFEVVALAASRVSPLLLEQCAAFRPRLVAVSADQPAPPCRMASPSSQAQARSKRPPPATMPTSSSPPPLVTAESRLRSPRSKRERPSPLPTRRPLSARANW